MKNLPPVFNTLPVVEMRNPLNLYNSTADEDHLNTPMVYGGAYVNAAVSSRFTRT